MCVFLYVFICLFIYVWDYRFAHVMAHIWSSSYFYFIETFFIFVPHCACQTSLSLSSCVFSSLFCPYHCQRNEIICCLTIYPESSSQVNFNNTFVLSPRVEYTYFPQRIRIICCLFVLASPCFLNLI